MELWPLRDSSCKCRSQSGFVGTNPAEPCHGMFSPQLCSRHGIPQTSLGKKILPFFKAFKRKKVAAISFLISLLPLSFLCINPHRTSGFWQFLSKQGVLYPFWEGWLCQIDPGIPKPSLGFPAAPSQPHVSLKNHNLEHLN